MVLTDTSYNQGTEEQQKDQVVPMLSGLLVVEVS